MHITFGWGFDGARWDHAAAHTTRTARATTASAGLGAVTAGPTQLTEILATRLALSAPEADQPRRIAAFRSVLSRLLESATADSWPAASFHSDPWTVARELLTWRDELVAAGWDGTVDEHTPRRLRLLAAVERQLVDEPDWSPGTADVLHSVSRELSTLTRDTTPVGWPLGIDRIDLDGTVTELPPAWQRILSCLTTLGVTVTELPTPAPLGELTVLHADTAWDAAPAAARFLAELRESGGGHTVVAGQSTGLLDRELVRIGHPPLGVTPRETSSYAQVIPLYLRAMTSPHDIHALAGLLNTTITVDGTTTSLIPGQLRRTLIAALNNQPGVGGPAWDQAVTDAVDACAEHGAAAGRIREFNDLIRRRPLRDEDGYATSDVSAHLEWLQHQFTSQGRGRSESSSIGSRIAPLRELIGSLGERISARELDQVIAEFTDTGGMTLNASADSVSDVVTDPAGLGCGTAQTVWWLPVDDTATPKNRARPTEIEWLGSRGIELPDPEALARLSLDSQLRALRRRGRVTAVTVDSVHGTAVLPHPALTFLRDDLHRQGLHPVTRPARLPELSGTTPEPVVLSAPDPVSRRFTPGEHLLPTRISFSQWEKLLVHPLEWLLERRLGVRAGGLATVPSGNQMVGTWLHTVVETIVNRHLDDNNGAPVTVHADADEIAGELRRLLPWYASPLQLPGRSRELGATLALAEESIAGLFTVLVDAGIRVSAVEASFTTTVAGSHGPDGADLELGGLRDIDVLLADGTPGVIDLKYTFATKKYRDAVQDGTALQLAVYAASVAGEHDRAHLADVPVAYFNLRDNRLDTTDPRFGAPETLTVEASDLGAADADELWRRAVIGLNHVLDELRSGHITDLGNLVTQKAWQRWESPPRGTSPQSPYDESTTETYTRALSRARGRGFFPENTAKYTNYPLLTGAEGDYA